MICCKVINNKGELLKGKMSLSKSEMQHWVLNYVSFYHIKCSLSL